MCVVSMVTGPYTGTSIPYPPVPTWPVYWVYKVWEDVQKAKKIDDDMGYPDCQSDDKTEFLKALDERIRKLQEIKDAIPKGR